MSKGVTVIVLVLVVGLVVEAMHVHPHWGKLLEDEDVVTTTAPQPADVVEIAIDPQNINSARFVPLNNAIFFQLRSPCQPGFQRDFLGICREVW